MNDLIFREAAMALAKDICVPTKDGAVYKHRCIDPDAIKELPSAQPEQQWVPCSEGPPKEESEVLVTTSWNDVCKAWYSNGKWRAEFINEYDDGEILAWMPLPEPYKEKNESQRLQV